MTDHKVKKWVNPNAPEEGYRFLCPGCNEHHQVWTKHIHGNPAWSFNGSLTAPTFTPSILVTKPAWKDDDEVLPSERCHSFVTNGNIRFLTDCSHALAGQTVPLPNIEKV